MKYHVQPYDSPVEVAPIPTPEHNFTRTNTSTSFSSASETSDGAIAQQESSKSSSSTEAPEQDLQEYSDPEEPTALHPNKLSEELVRCMAAIFCKLADPPLQAPQLVPFSPSSSTNSSSTGGTAVTTSSSSTSPHEMSNGPSWSPRWRTESSSLSGELAAEHMGERQKELQQELRDHGSLVPGPSTAMVDVPWICVDKDRLAYAARALRNFRYRKKAAP